MLRRSAAMRESSAACIRSRSLRARRRSLIIQAVASPIMSTSSALFRANPMPPGNFMDLSTITGSDPRSPGFVQAYDHRRKENRQQIDRAARRILPWIPSAAAIASRNPKALI